MPRPFKNRNKSLETGIAERSSNSCCLQYLESVCLAGKFQFAVHVMIAWVVWLCCRLWLNPVELGIWLHGPGLISITMTIVMSWWENGRSSLRNFLNDHYLMGAYILLSRVNTTRYSLHSPSYYGSKLWNSLPKTTKSMPTVAAFKSTIRNLQFDTDCCPFCR